MSLLLTPDVPAGELRQWCMQLEHRLNVAHAIAQSLWRQLASGRRRELYDQDLDVFALAAVDPAIEAMLRLGERQHIHVEPCRAVLDSQRWGEEFLLVLPSGEKRNVSRDMLLMMAGLPAEGERA